MQSSITSYAEAAISNLVVGLLTRSACLRQQQWLLSLRLSELVSWWQYPRPIFKDSPPEVRRAILYLRRSKTDQWGIGQGILLGECSVTELCPVGRMHDYLMLKGDGQGYMFQEGSPLTTFQFWNVTSATLEKAGITG